MILNSDEVIRNYLTKDLCQKEDLYLFQKQGYDYKITDKDYEDVELDLEQKDELAETSKFNKNAALLHFPTFTC